jgi:hypothetical protein
MPSAVQSASSKPTKSDLGRIEATPVVFWTWCHQAPGRGRVVYGLARAVLSNGVLLL